MDLPQTNVDKSTTFNPFSLKGIADRKKAQEKSSEVYNSQSAQTMTSREPFTATDVLVIWQKFANRLEQKGQKILYALMTLNEPTIRGNEVIIELPNEGNREEFERTRIEIQGMLRNKLQNVDIEVQVHVNEEVVRHKAYTPQEKFNEMIDKNPAIDLLRKLFDTELT